MAMRIVTLLALIVVGGCTADLPTGEPARLEPTVATDPRPPIRVRVATAERRALAGTTVVPVVVHPFQEATISAKVAGRVAVRLAEPGDPVAKDAPLLGIDETDLSLAVQEAEHASALAAAELSEARSQVERGRALHREHLISTSERDTLQTAFEAATAAEARAAVQLAKAKQAQVDATVRAPFDGTVEVVEADVGEFLQPGAPVATLVDFSRARLRAGVTASEAAHLAPGTPAEVSFDVLGGATIEAELRSVARVADAGTGTYTVELWLDDPDPRLRAGMVGQLRLREEAGEAHVVVPRTALVRRAGRVSLFVVVGEPGGLHAAERRVGVGRRNDRFVEVVAGLEPGEQVVVDGHFALGEGAPVAVENRSG